MDRVKKAINASRLPKKEINHMKISNEDKKKKLSAWINEVLEESKTQKK